MKSDQIYISGARRNATRCIPGQARLGHQALCLGFNYLRGSNAVCQVHECLLSENQNISIEPEEEQVHKPWSYASSKLRLTNFIIGEKWRATRSICWGSEPKQTEKGNRSSESEQEWESCLKETDQGIVSGTRAGCKRVGLAIENPIVYQLGMDGTLNLE